MAEWSIAAVLKTVEANYLQGFESLSLRIFFGFTIKKFMQAMVL